MKAVEMVHILGSGQVFCDTVTGVPKDWPEGHAWVPIDESKEATCWKCIYNLKRFHANQRTRPKSAEEECESH